MRIIKEKETLNGYPYLCDKEFDIFGSIRDYKTIKCPQCNKKMQRPRNGFPTECRNCSLLITCNFGGHSWKNGTIDVAPGPVVFDPYNPILKFLAIPALRKDFYLSLAIYTACCISIGISAGTLLLKMAF